MEEKPCRLISLTSSQGVSILLQMTQLCPSSRQRSALLCVETAFPLSIHLQTDAETVPEFSYCELCCCTRGCAWLTVIEDFSCVRTVSRRETAGSNAISSFSFLRNLHTDFQDAYTGLHPHRQCRRVLQPPSTCYDLIS